MARRQPGQRTNSSETQDSAPKDPSRTRTQAEDVENAPETGREDGQPPSIDEIRLQAYHRYLQRQGGDDDEIADWLAAESQLRERAAVSRADGRKGEQP